MEDVVQKIWDALPSVQLLVASGAAVSDRQSVLLPDEEASLLMCCLHKACFANATLEDSKAATARAMEMGGDAQKSYAWLSKVLREVIAAEWIDRCFHDAPAPATGRPQTKTPGGGDDETVAVLTAVEEQLKAIAECITDDKDPQPLLAYDQVLTVAVKPLRMHTPFSAFVTLTTYKVHPPVYYDMWAKLIGSYQDTSISTIDLNSFVRWFTFMYRMQFSNASPSRARIAASAEWLAVLQSKGGDMSFEDFITAAKRFATRYGKQSASVGGAIETYYETIVRSVEQSGNSEGKDKQHNFFDAALPTEGSPIAQVTLVDAKDMQPADELDADACDAAYFQTPTQNRVLVSGHMGIEQTTLLAKHLASKLNAVLVDVKQAAIAAIDTAESSNAAANTKDDADVAAAILACVAEGQQVPLSLRAKLVRRVLSHPATQHRGYVFGDLPTTDSAALDAYLLDCGLTAPGNLPQQIVKAYSTDACTEELVAAYSKTVVARREASLALRREEQAVLDEKAAAKAIREGKRAAKAERAERKARIEAGEIQLTEEEAAAEPPVDDGEEDVEEPVEMDDEGNPMEPEAVVQRDAARARDRQRRILLEDVAHALTPTFGTPEPPCDVLSVPALKTTVAMCSSGRRMVEVGLHGAVEDACEHIASYLSLGVSTVPLQVPLPEDTPENADGSADGDLVIAEAKQRVVSENPALSFSKWRRYCPVTFQMHHVLVEGSMAFSVTYRGRVYCFASSENMQRFIDAPHPFLTQRVSGVAPVLIMKRTLDVFTKSASLAPASLESSLAETLGLTVNTFSTFTDVWGKQRALAASRDASETARAVADAKQRIGREERLKKRLEAEAKKKKKDGDKKKAATKKKDDDGGAQDEAPAGDGAEVVEAVPVETTSARLSKIVNMEVEKARTFCPLLVSTLDDIDEETFSALFDHRVLPPTVVVLDYEEPRPEGEEEAVEGDEGDEEPAEEEAPEELDEDGQPKPKPPPKPKVVDLTDDKQYRRLMKKLLAKLSASTDASGSDPEPAEEGKPAPKPFQSFNVIAMNVFNKTQQEVVDDVVLAVHPLAINAQPPQDGEDIAVDPEPEEGDLRNPLLIPGPKAVHQYGATLKYCPVSLRDRGVLTVGDASIWLSFKGKKYTFASAEAMNTFKTNPHRYTSNVSVTVPPRLWMVGVPFSGKRTLAQKLSAPHNIPLFTFEDAYFDELIAACTSESGGNVRGMFIPAAGECPFARRAATIAEELRAFDEDQRQKLVRKDVVQQEQTEREERRDAGEEVEELDEEDEAEIQQALEFEPEEAEAKEERVGKARRQIAAALTRIEPFNSQGYILVGHPSSEAEMQGLVDEGAYPDVVLHVRISTETFVGRQLQTEFETRNSEQVAKQKLVEEKRKAIQQKLREVELRKWRRRNIGADDAPEEDEAEEAPEDVEPVTLEGVRGDLESLYETENGNVSAVVAALPDRRIPVIELSGDGGLEQLHLHAVEGLERILPCRRSLFQAVQVCTYDEAMSLGTSGVKMFSVFGLVDPVSLADNRCGKPGCLRMKQPGSVPTKEDEIPEEAPPPPKEKKYRTVTKTNEEGEEIEVEEEEPEEEVVVEEPEPEDPPEPEPEFSPEELDEMRKEHQEKQLAAANKKKRLAAFLCHRLYFFDNEANLLRFINDPLKFWDQSPPLPAIRAPMVSVFEPVPPPVDGVKPRSMAEHLAFNTGAVYLSIPKLLQWAVLQDSLGTLQARARDALVQGQEPNSECIALLLVNRLMSADIQKRGVVLENLPRDEHQVNVMYDASLCLSKCFVFDDVLANVANAIASLSCVVRPVTEEPYTMASLRAMVRDVETSVERQGERVLRTALGFPASTYHTPILEATIRNQRSQYQWYCPYMWTRHEQLVEDPLNRQFVIEYLGSYFCFSNIGFFDEFMTHPETVSGESLSYGTGVSAVQKLELPSILPAHLTVEEAKQLEVSKIPLELAGCCPVTLYETRWNVGLRGVAEPKAVLGDAQRFVANYNDKYYAMLSQDHMTMFLRQPWVFTKFAVLPAADKLPYDPASLSGAPDELYITRTMREATAKAMLAVCRQRPKYPGLTPEESALKFIALYLKAHNPANSEIAAQQYRHNYEQFATEASLYKTVKTEAPSDEEGRKVFHQLCHAWDRVQDHPQAYQDYIHLQRDHAASEQ